MLYCRNCGAKIERGECFCSNCGKPQRPQARIAKEHRGYSRKAKTFLLIIIPLVFISLLVLVLILWAPWVDTSKFMKAKIKDESQSMKLVLKDGAAIIVPPGSLPVGATVSVQKLNTADAPDLPEWGDSVKSLYKFYVDCSLQGPITVQLPLPKDKIVSVLGHYNNGEWEIIPFIIKGDVASMEIEDLSLFGWLDVNLEWFNAKVLDFLTLNWLEDVGTEPFCQDLDEGINIEEENTFGLVSGCAHINTDGEIRIIIRNEAPVHMDVYPILEDAVRIKGQLERPGVYIFQSQHSGGSIIAPHESAEWAVELNTGDSITFKAYFSDAALASFIGDIIPYGRLSRALIESSLFTRYGREMTWADIKGLLIIPTFAEFAKFTEDLRPEHILDEGTLVITRKIRIAFASDRDGNWEIYIMNVDGSEQTRLTNNPADDLSHCFSPDGSKIAFTSDRDGNYEIYMMNADGSGQVKLTNNPAVDFGPCFSP